MGLELLINVRPHQTRVALLENGQLVELYIERKKDKHLLGNIYKGRVIRVLPGMQSAFVDIGYERSGFLFVSDMCIDRLPWKEFEKTLLESLIQEEGEVEIGNMDTERTQKERPIEDLLKEGQELMVQVSKDPVGLKGPRLTCNVSLPGRHLVLMPTMNHLGVSKKIEDGKERERLRSIVSNLRTNNYGYIVRTASEGVDEEKLKKEMEFLTSLWENIKARMEKSGSPKLLYNELSISLRAVRDLFTMEVDKLIIDSYEDYQSILEFMDTFAPNLKSSVEFYNKREPLFDAYGIEIEINRALQRKVWLKSGGYIVIEPTEAFTVIDVNTGSFVGKRDLEDTIFKTNLEAAKEIAYQLRLRNIAGIVVIDFIDMQHQSNREKLVEAFKEYLKKDKAKTTLLPISNLGLLEMTRKRTRSNLYSIMTEPCPCCDGRGYVRSKSAITDDILRKIEEEAFLTPGNTPIKCKVSKEIETYIKEEEHDALLKLEKRLGRRIVLMGQGGLHQEDFEVIS